MMFAAPMLAPAAENQAPSRQTGRRFHVALGPEVTIVSYKQLCRDHEAAHKPAKVHGAAGAAGSEDVDVEEPPAGAEGDDDGKLSEGDSGEEDEEEEDGDEPGTGTGSDEDESERSYDGEAGHGYDVNDNFIDDSEAMETPEHVAKAKHSGYFINKGTIERVGEPVPPPSDKRRRLELSMPARHGTGPGVTKKASGAAMQAVAGNAALDRAVEELRAVVKAAPAPAESVKRRLTPEMLSGLAKIKVICSTLAELPRGLSSLLHEFMAPFANKDTLRRRISSNDVPSGAGPGTAGAQAEAGAAAAQQQPLPSAAPRPVQATPAGPRPTDAAIERDLQLLRDRVKARCAALQPADDGGEADEFQPMFKWDRDCEEALYAVIVNSQRSDPHKHNKYKELLTSGIWPARYRMDSDALKLAYSRVHKRKKASGASGGGGGSAKAPGGAPPDELVQLGTLVVQPGWCTTGFIFPDGYTWRKSYKSSVNLDQNCVHTCTITSQGPFAPAPTFRITVADRAAEPVEGKTAGACWNQVAARVNEAEAKRREANGEPPVPLPKGDMPGPKYFGLKAPHVVAAIEALDKDHQCKRYWEAKAKRRDAGADAAGADE